MSNIVTIAGSPSSISSSDALLAYVSRRILRAGHDVTPLVLRDLPPAAYPWPVDRGLAAAGKGVGSCRRA